jgi:hypothetical protein
MGRTFPGVRGSDRYRVITRLPLEPEAQNTHTHISQNFAYTWKYRPKYQPTSTSIWYINTDTGQAASIKTVYISNIVNVLTVLETQNLEPDRTIWSFTSFYDLQS